MPGQKVFLIGPGFIGRQVVDLMLSEEDYEVTTLARRPEAAKELEEHGVKVRMGGLDDADIISDQAYNSDTVIHTATADHLPSVEAVFTGIRKRAVEGKNTIYIHTSGAGLMDDNAKGMFKSDKVWSDDYPEDINALPDSAPHRDVDLFILGQRKALGARVKSAIFLPPTIYGIDPKYGRLSIQLPSLVRFALKRGYAGYVGKGEAVWSSIHVFDLARAFVVVLHWLESSPAAADLKNPYFFCENGTESSWAERAEFIGEALHGMGKVASPVPKSIPINEYDDLLGSMTDSIVGTNARCKADRLRRMGWSPREKSWQDSLVQEEIPHLLKW